LARDREDAALPARIAPLTPIEAVDVLVLGAGPAGAAFATALAPRRRVLVIDRHPGPRPRIGESLPAAAWRLLAKLGHWEAFRADGHLPCFGRRSVWGGPALLEFDSLRDLDGHSWLLDRARFEAGLRAAAVSQGADIIAPARVEAIEHDAGGWLVRVGCRWGSRLVRANVLVDGRGRAGRPLPGSGAKRLREGRLICAWAVGVTPAEDAAAATVIHVQSDAEGWWYSAPLPGRARVLAFHTDADLLAAAVRTLPGLVGRARELPELAAIIGKTRFLDEPRWGICAAHGSLLEPACGSDWFAIGDAASAFDPLASQGLFHALYTGVEAAKAADCTLAGDPSGAAVYRARVAAVWSVYSNRLRATYALEPRWPAHPFWQRRWQAV
jgi:flavin-dependent dehydrogenase